MHLLNNTKIKKTFGIGMDMPWDHRDGFVRAPIEGPSPHIHQALKFHSESFDHFFFAFQPKNRNLLQTKDYIEAYENLFKALPARYTRGFHQTVLNMGSTEEYDKKRVIDFTNKICAHFGIMYVNEDLGIWSMKGKSLPYPMPPFLTKQGLQACVDNIKAYQDGLSSELLVEFPGFTEGCSFIVGNMDAFDYFSEIVDKTQSTVTIDTGHILGYQWFRGKKQEEFLDDLDSLPFDKTFEIHLSGSNIVDGQFRDLHHGVLMDEQLDLLEMLLSKCPNVKSVVYEDPKFTSTGEVISKAKENFYRLKNIVKSWKGGHYA